MIDPSEITQELWYAIVIGVLASAGALCLFVNIIVTLVKRGKNKAGKPEQKHTNNRYFISEQKVN